MYTTYGQTIDKAEYNITNKGGSKTKGKRECNDHKFLQTVFRNDIPLPAKFLRKLTNMNKNFTPYS